VLPQVEVSLRAWATLGSKFFGFVEPEKQPILLYR